MTNVVLKAYLLDDLSINEDATIDGMLGLPILLLICTWWIQTTPFRHLYSFGIIRRSCLHTP
jgi:hypothetical protein